MYFVVLRRTGPEWDASKPLEAQSGWDEHAAYMDALAARGFVVLGGPLHDEERVVLCVEAASEHEVREVLGADPWSGTHLVVDSVDAWTVRLDGRRLPGAGETTADEVPPDVDVAAANERERARMAAIVERLDDDQLLVAVNEHWTVAGVLGHIAFWDARVIALAAKLRAGLPFSPSDSDPEDVDWINDASRPLIHAIDPRHCARVALQIAEETDRLAAQLDPADVWPGNRDSPINPQRFDHRGEHLDEVEAALARERA